MPKYFVSNLLNECKTPADGFDIIGGLFEAMNSKAPKTGGRFKGVPYFNGGLFAQPARIEINDLELALLKKAAEQDWSKVQPEIFGTLFQHSMDDEERHAYGAHFTHPSDIMKIVKPTITDPWSEQIESARTRKRLRELLQRMHHFRVLDPACGCGNFLYVSYRELKRLEARIFERMETEFKSEAEPGQLRLSFLSAQNFYGLDILPFAIEIAKVTMMIARKLAIDELHISEPPLPLDNLDQNFIAADALLTPEGLPAQWPKADVIIGNPPYLGSRYLAKEHGYEYVRKVHALFPDVPKMADYCVYWFRRAHDHLPACTPNDSVAGRAGLVGTKTIRQNESREASLDYIVKNGGTITEAVSKQVWSGEAAVHVSIVNWAKGEHKGKKRLFTQVGDNVVSDWKCEEVDHIGPTLTTDTDASAARILSVNQNPKCVYVGQYPFNEGFWLDPDEAAKLLSEHPDHREVLFPYMIGRDLVDSGQPSRWIIDFAQRNMLEAARYTAAFERVKKLVMPVVVEKGEREIKATGKDSTRWSRLAKRWWQLRDYQPGTMAAISRVPRYIACSRVTKRPIFEFISQSVHPDNTLMVFPFADDYSFGILQSDVHWVWFTARCSTLGGTFRYTSDTVFDTFPWPQFEMGSSRREEAHASQKCVLASEADWLNQPPATYQEMVAQASRDLGRANSGMRAAVSAHQSGLTSAATIAKIDAVAAAAREVRRVRAEALRNLKGGLRALYRTLELPGANPLKDAHAALDAA
ncbi:MAG: class I SAM-dependent DNA methyltransferase, partial [Verrucomicrobia bacterium]|nr:class I SAM-dependent DNA methyltransferase [Verrucomicrobiota bacterium]